VHTYHICFPERQSTTPSISQRVPMKPTKLLQRNLLITFDAFGTLFTPKQSIAKQYGDVARRYGIYNLDEADIETSFRVGKYTSTLIF
jgi:hypothetical protein